MTILIDIAPWLAAMAVLIGLSAFFSGSEAALFSLRWLDRRAMAQGTRAERSAELLLHDPDRLLSAVLFWNLAVNILYFSIASIVGIRLQERPELGRGHVVLFSVVILLALIFFSEMLPKSFAVMRPRPLVRFAYLPLILAVRVLDPVMPFLRTVNLFSRRLLLPAFQSEPYLDVSDLDRAIELSNTDRHLVDQEEIVLRNIVSLSDIRADEWMRPRRQFRAFCPPVRLTDLAGKVTPSGYVLVAEPDGHVVSAVHLEELDHLDPEHLERHTTPVIYLPWCATVADALQTLQHECREVAAVVNELGETIGVLTLEDILESIFTENPGRTERLWNREPIQRVRDNTWLTEGITNLRRLASYFEVDLPESRHVTVGGVVQESLEKLPEVGDVCEWGPFRIEVVAASEDHDIDVQLTCLDEDRPS